MSDTTIPNDEVLDPIRVFTIKLTTEMAITGKVPEKIWDLESELEEAFVKKQELAVLRGKREELVEMADFGEIHHSVLEYRLDELDQKIKALEE